MVKKIMLSSLANGIEGVTKGFGGYMMECAGYSFMQQNHVSGVRLKVKTDKQDQIFEVYWNTMMSSTLKKTTADSQRTVEFGAMGLAILLTLKLTKYKCFETSSKGSGIDFWLYEEESDDLDFSKGARLEVSGIMKETKVNTVKKRVGVKKKQSTKSQGSNKVAYISVSEFGTPKSAYETA